MPTEPTLFGRMRALWRGILDRIGIGSKPNATKRVYLILTPYPMLAHRDSVNLCPVPGRKSWENWDGSMPVRSVPKLASLQRLLTWINYSEDGRPNAQLWTGLDLPGQVTIADMAALYERSATPAVLQSFPR